MDRVDAAVDLFTSGCACSQAVLAAFAPRYGLDESQALRLASGFAAGMRMGETCGVVTGAIMVLGLARATDACRAQEGREAVYEAMATFRQQFRARHGTLICRDLLDCNIATPEGLQLARDRNLFATTCVRVLRDAVTILESMLEA